MFVPRPDGEAEDDPVVLAVGSNTAEERSYLHVVDGETTIELGRERLPHALPLDFHAGSSPPTVGGLRSKIDN